MQERELVTCRADTHIHVEDEQIRHPSWSAASASARSRPLLGVRSTFDLESADQDDESFWRTCRLWGDGFEYRITETFPAGLYEVVPDPA